MWGESKEGNAMKTTGRLQTLLTREQLREAERWSDEHILPAVADAWETRGTGKDDGFGWAGSSLGEDDKLGFSRGVRGGE